ncbi:MAG: hypothetical protein NTW54_07560 [Bacteroidetes bacterium]|nr:hypothetical protein [Bacteroidota bacterium]
MFYSLHGKAKKLWCEPAAIQEFSSSLFSCELKLHSLDSIRTEFRAPLRNYLNILLLLFTFSLATAQTTVVKSGEAYTLMRNGSPYYVKGLGGEVNLDKVVEIGGNSIRTWGVDNAQQVLDEAQKKGLTVMLGFWLQPERHGFDYDNGEKVKKQFEHFKMVVNQFKNHPALLMWGIGNELDLDYSNPNCWDAVQDIAKYIHQTDPNHPTSTVTAGLDSMEVLHIKKRCPDIDIYCINTYGDIGNVPKNISNYGWTGPYMITEWGPNGHWESPQTSWGVSLEQSSSEKKESYYTRYKNYIEPYKNHCLGSYAFLWGAKQEYTETWYGLFSKENVPTEPIDALEEVFTGKAITKPAPAILRFSIQNQTGKENIILKAEEKSNAFVSIQLLDSATNKSIKYKWRIVEESTDKKSGGDVENEAREVLGLIIKGRASNKIIFRAPVEPGLYRLFVSVMSNGKIAYANIPFKVIPREPGDKQAKLIKIKHTEMKDFEL